MQHALPSSKRLLWPWLLALPPAAAVLGGIVIFIVLARHPDRDVRTPPPAPLSQEEQRHVTNSVVPPLE